MCLAKIRKLQRRSWRICYRGQALTTLPKSGGQRSFIKLMAHLLRRIKLPILTISLTTIVTTIFLRLSLSNTASLVQEQRRSTVNISESLQDFFINSKRLIAKLDTTLNEQIKSNSDYWPFVANDLHNIVNIIHQMDIHVEGIARNAFLSEPVINNHSFSYTHNPADACSRTVKLLLVVPSTATNFEKRQAARNGSRGDYVRNSTNKSKMLFFLGKSSSGDIHIQEQIDEEAKKYGDIVQENFEDIYKNNRLKSVSMLRWVGTHCSNDTYIIRSDDDIIINVTAIVSVIEWTAKNLNYFVIGKKLINDPPCRDITRKYYLSKEEYSLDVLPPYLLGGLLGYPARTGKVLYEAALRVKPIWLEDVYITGMCAPKVHVPILTFPEFQFQHTNS